MSFTSDAKELFGLSRAEASELREVLEEEEGFNPRQDSLYDDEWGPLASDYLDDVIEGFEDYGDDTESRYDLDDRFEWGDDEWMDVGEYEITVEYGETTT